MDGGVELEQQSRIVVVRVPATPAGRLDADGLRALIDELDRIESADDIRGLIIAGARGIFCAGADHRSLVDAGLVHDLDGLATRIEDLSVPVIAAIDGACFGVGAELALAADLRIAQVRASIGFSDITVGLPPIAGATRRLPRLIDPDDALKMLLSGRPVTARVALEKGLVSGVTEGDPVAEAQKMLEASVDVDPYPELDNATFLRATNRHKIAAARVPIEAPLRVVECVEAGLLVPIEIFRNMQEIAFDDLWASDEAQALAHIDGVERRAARLQRIVKPKARPVEKIAVAGARGSAQGIAVSALRGGFDVTMSDSSDDLLEAGVIRVIEHIDADVAAGRLSETDAEARLDRIHAVSGYQTVGQADLVFDIVNARGAASKSLISELDAVMKAGAILATGSTQVGADTIGAITTRPSDVVAVRFFGPYGERRAVEVSPGRKSAPVALGTVIAVLNRMQRLPIIFGEGCRGVGARMMAALHAVADHLLHQGASVAQIDDTLRAWGLPGGSFAERDARGILAPSPRSADPAAGRGLDGALAGMGQKGVVSGRGYYVYAPDEAPVPNPVIERLLADARRRRNIEPRSVSATEIRLSAIAAMANAGAHCIADGSAARPEQLDLLSVHGLGLSRRAGGVMQAADLAGLDRVFARLKALHEENDALAGPAPLFTSLLKSGQSFADLNAA